MPSPDARSARFYLVPKLEFGNQSVAIATCPLPILITIILLLTCPIPAHAQDPVSSPSVAGGQLHWVENCQPCHGPTGQGDGPSAEAIAGPLPDFSGPATARQLVPIQNFDVIKNGRIDKLMPPWGDQLSDGQIWDAAAYVWYLSTTPQDLDAGEGLYTTRCAACHGESGMGDGPEASAEMVDFTNLEEMAQRSQTILQANYAASNEHAELGMSETELWQTLDYIRTFSFAVPEHNGVLTGQVINGTTNQPQADLEITLHAFQDNAEIVTLTTQAGSEGRYAFEKLPTEHTIFYMLEAEYQGIPYVTDEPGVFAPGNSETTLNLSVYETTTSNEAINVEQAHYILSFSGEAVNVTQIFIINNTGNQTYIGQNGQTFAFALPDQATNIGFQEEFPGARFIQTENGYADTAPIPPNIDDFPIAASYNIFFDDDTLTIETPIPTDINALNVLMNEQGARLDSEQLEFIETRQMGDSTLAIFSGGNLRQGDTLTFQLSNLDDLDLSGAAAAPEATVAASTPVSQDAWRWIVIGLGVAIIVIAGVVYPLTRPQLAHPADLDYNDPQIHRQKLLLTLARLDEAFEAGELDEAVYHQTRARYKAELAEIMAE
jgi:mono/diheme cytochrome c family protein